MVKRPMFDRRDALLSKLDRLSDSELRAIETLVRAMHAARLSGGDERSAREVQEIKLAVERRQFHLLPALH